MIRRALVVILDLGTVAFAATVVRVIADAVPDAIVDLQSPDVTLVVFVHEAGSGSDRAPRWHLFREVRFRAGLVLVLP